MTTRCELLMLMNKYDANCIEIARLLDVKPQTVRAWRSASGRPMPARAMELLRLKIKEAGYLPIGEQNDAI